MQLLKQYSNGMWGKVDADKEDFYIEKILNRESWLAPRLKREQMTTKEQILEYLKTGKELHWDDEWYAVIKMEMPKKHAPPVEMVKCDCGHSVPRCTVMGTSTGTSCPDCYDRMSM
jgi:hypothetical protein